MQTTYSRAACCCLLLAFAAHFCLLHGQLATSPQKSSLREFFEALSQTQISSVPQWDEFDKVESSIPSTPAATVADALPAIVANLSNNNSLAQNYACVALVAISLRPDSADLLGRFTAPITETLNSPDERLQKAAVFVLGGMEPKPLPEALKNILAFVSQHGRSNDAQLMGISALLRNMPDNSDVVQAVKEFALRSLDDRDRITLLYAIRSSLAHDPRIVATVIQSLDNAHAGVKIAAILTLDRMGESALQQAEPILIRLAVDDLQPSEVKREANRVLNRIGQNR